MVVDGAGTAFGMDAGGWMGEARSGEGPAKEGASRSTDAVSAIAGGPLGAVVKGASDGNKPPGPSEEVPVQDDELMRIKDIRSFVADVLRHVDRVHVHTGYRAEGNSVASDSTDPRGVRG